jgi:pyridoxine 5'-phosphate synthase PdxJ
VRRLTVSLETLVALRGRLGAGALDLAAAATLAELSGADAVRVGLNEEGHPRDGADLRDLRRAAGGLELRISPAPALVKVALEARPERVLLSSESRDGLRSPMPLDFQAWGGALAPVVRTLEEAGIDVGVLVPAELEGVKGAHGADARRVELHTGRLVDLPPAERSEALVRLGDAARLASKLRLRATVGGGLDLRAAERVLEAAPVVEGVAVGRAWVARSLLVGIDRATRDWRAAVA